MKSEFEANAYKIIATWQTLFFPYEMHNKSNVYFSLKDRIKCNYSIVFILNGIFFENMWNIVLHADIFLLKQEANL